MAIINKGMSRRSFLGLTGSVAAVAGLGLTGCGGSSSDEGSASGSTDSANRGGGVITAGSAYAPSSFDPASTGSAVGLGANWHVIEGLYGIDYHDYSTFNELATDDPKSVDDTTFEVTIRKGAKFSDGTEVTADDVVASYTACAASATYAPFFQPFESIEAKDASTVTVKTKVPNFSLLKDRLANHVYQLFRSAFSFRIGWPMPGRARHSMQQVPRGPLWRHRPERLELLQSPARLLRANASSSQNGA